MYIFPIYHKYFCFPFDSLLANQKVCASIGYKRLMGQIHKKLYKVYSKEKRKKNTGCFLMHFVSSFFFSQYIVLCVSVDNFYTRSIVIDSVVFFFFYIFFLFDEIKFPFKYMVVGLTFSVLKLKSLQ